MFGRCIHNIDTLSCLPRIQFINPCVSHLTNKVKENHCLTGVWLENCLCVLCSSYVNIHMYIVVLYIYLMLWVTEFLAVYIFTSSVQCVCIFVFQDD